MERNNQASSLQILTGPLAGQTFPIYAPAITIGRDPSNDIVLLDQAVSRRHARIEYQPDGQWRIEKLTPNNTLLVNQKAIQQAVVHDQDVVSLGANTSFRFISQMQQAAPRNTGRAAEPAPHTPTIAVALPVQPPNVAPKGTQIALPLDQIGEGVPSLEISTNTGRPGQTFQLTKPVITI